MKSLGTICIVGGESLLGRELREILAEQRMPAKIKLIGVDEAALTLTEAEGEPAVLTPLDEESILDSQIAVLAGSADSSRKALAMAAKRPAGPALIDMTYVAEEQPAARLRAPVAESNEHTAPAGAVHVIAHPAAIALALVLVRLASRFKVRRSIAHVFEPASERGRKGLDELRQQTVSLLSFQSMRKEIFDAQLAFSMLSSYGSQAPEALESVELRIERHLASLLSLHSVAPMPSLRVVQAPVFHGHSISLYVEFDKGPAKSALAAALASPEVDVRGEDLDPPNNAGIAGQGGIAVGSISTDRNHADAFWFWAVADNFRLMAENAAAVARSLLRAAAPGEGA